MASTQTLQQTVNYAATQTDLMPLAGIGGYTNEPALTFANDAVAEILAPPFAWKFNQKTAPIFVTGQGRQDSRFAGACAFVLESPGGVGVELASANGVVEVGTTVTVKTLDRHNFTVGQTVYMTGNTVAAYNSTETISLNSSAWSGGWVILTTPTSTSFTFTHASSGLAVSGAPGITDFRWLESASMVSELDTSSPRGVDPVQASRKLQTSGTMARPDSVCVSDTSTAGIVLVRFRFAPDSTPWGVSLVYQMKPPVFTALTATWAPIPDEFAYVYRQMFLAKAYANTQKADVEYKKAQIAVNKALSSDDSEQSDEYFTPAASLMGNDGGW
jgi:hypothetical protein